MIQATLAPTYDISVNAGTLARQDASCTFVTGPRVDTGIGEILAVAATTQQLITLGWQVLLQPEDGSTPAYHPTAPTVLFTRDGDIVFFSQMGIEIRRGKHDQHAFPHNPTSAAAFFARHATAH